MLSLERGGGGVYRGTWSVLESISVTMQSSLESYYIQILPMDITSKQLNMQSSLETIAYKFAIYLYIGLCFYYIN